MKQAILIGAYKKPELLKKLIGLFPAEHFNIYIHLNIIGEIDVHYWELAKKNKLNVLTVFPPICGQYKTLPSNIRTGNPSTYDEYEYPKNNITL
jgi:hypothetical protein